MPLTVPKSTEPWVGVEFSPRFCSTSEPWQKTLTNSPRWKTPTSCRCCRSSSVVAALVEEKQVEEGGEGLIRPEENKQGGDKRREKVRAMRGNRKEAEGEVESGRKSDALQKQKVSGLDAKWRFSSYVGRSVRPRSFIYVRL